ncbi:MAG: hypothetical protein EAX87_04130 [Candidatus Thorarchaeota archaeon]|nr:hypothetical protein [Candidatus Thorarchaeota archaeon]
MSDKQIDRDIENYMKRIAKLLPDGFETEDLLEDLRAHIYESFNAKVQKEPTEDKHRLIMEVLQALGTPEEIAEEYGKEKLAEEETSPTDRWIYYTMRLTVAILVIVLASWIVSVISEGAINFALAVVVLLAFALLEWVVRTQQTKDA